MVLAASAFTLLLAAAATAEPVDKATMQRELHTYFEGEKAEGIAFLGAGLAAFATGSALLGRRTAFARGVAWPVIIVGVIQTAAGIVVYSRTDAQVTRLDAQMATDPAGLRKAEVARMRRVSTEFVLLKWTELGLAATGVGLATLGIAKESETLKGVGIGLFIQSTAMLVLDLFAAERATRYLDALEKFQVSFTTSPAHTGSALTVGTWF